MPKKQPTAAKKARSIQRASGEKYTNVLAGQVCGETLDPWGEHDDGRTEEDTWADLRASDWED